MDRLAAGPGPLNARTAARLRPRTGPPRVTGAAPPGGAERRRAQQPSQRPDQKPPSAVDRGPWVRSARMRACGLDMLAAGTATADVRGLVCGVFFGNRRGRAARAEVSDERWHQNVRLMLSRRAVVFWLVLAIWIYMVRVVITVLRDDVRASDALLDPYGLGLAPILAPGPESGLTRRR